MDPITVIGTVGSIVSIVDLVAKTITGIWELRNDWKDADITLFSLITQLNAINGALRKIDEWTNVEGVDDPHHQLVMDLEMSVNCCRFLIGKIEGHLPELKRQPGEISLDFASKFRMVFKGSSIGELQRQIGHQVTALNLLLTACNCKAVADQGVIVEKSSTRKVMKKVKQESASLIVHRDSASFRTCITDNLSKLSVVFSFDRELFGSLVYDRVLRGSIKDRLRMQQSGVASSTASKKSLEIERSLKNDEKRTARDVRMVVLGGPGSGKDQVIRQMQLIHPPKFLANERRFWRFMIFDHIINSTQLLIESFTVYDVTTLPTNEKYGRFLNGYSTEADNYYNTTSLGADVAEAVKSIWSDPNVPLVRERYDLDGILGSIDYYIENLDRISETEYLPTDQDIIHVSTSRKVTGKVAEHKFDFGNQTYVMYDVGSLRSERKKWLPMFEGIGFILFIVNMSGYDQCLVEDKDANMMQESIMLFDSLVNSQWFRRTSFIVFFNKTNLFKDKLPYSRVNKYFPDYQGDPGDYAQATDYFQSRFSSLNRNPDREMYFHYTNERDTDLLKITMASVQDAIIQKNNKDLIL